MKNKKNVIEFNNVAIHSIVYPAFVGFILLLSSVF